MIIEDAIHEAVDGLKNVCWRETAFADLQWYYAERGVYILRCKHGEPDEHLCVLRAKSADEAIARAVFDLHKSDDKQKAKAALAAPPRTGRWENGTDYEYEYAYCSACGRAQWADWDSHKQAEENIEGFAEEYKFCPGCGAKMEGGVYVK